MFSKFTKLLTSYSKCDFSNFVHHFLVLLRGRDFRQAYNELKDIRALMMSGLPMVALTATASGRTRNYVISKLDMEGCIVKNLLTGPTFFTRCMHFLRLSVMMMKSSSYRVLGL